MEKALKRPVDRPLQNRTQRIGPSLENPVTYLPVAGEDLFAVPPSVNDTVFSLGNVADAMFSSSALRVALQAVQAAGPAPLSAALAGAVQIVETALRENYGDSARVATEHSYDFDARDPELIIECLFGFGGDDTAMAERFRGFMRNIAERLDPSVRQQLTIVPAPFDANQGA